MNIFKNRSKLIFNTSIIAIIITIIVLGSLLMLSQNRLPQSFYANKGYIDLSNYDFANEDCVSLSGEWEFYTNEFLSSDDIKTGNYTPYYVNVPSPWSNYIIDGKPMPRKGYATYRILINIPDNNTLYGIRSTLIRTANTVYVNDQLIHKHGTPSITEDNSIPLSKPFVTFFPIKDDTVEIIIHASSYEYALGSGITNHIFFGSHNSISKEYNKALSYEWIVISGISIGIIYFLGLYFIIYFVNKRKIYSLLTFSLYLVGSLSYKITHGERLIFDLFPRLSYNLYYKIQLIPVTFCVIMISLYAYFLFKSKYMKYYTITITCLSIIAIIRILVLDPYIVSQTVWVEIALTTISSFYIFFIFLYNYLKKGHGSIMLLLGAIAVGSDAFVEGLSTFTTLGYNIVFPFQPFLFILSQIFLHSTFFSKSMEESEHLTQKVIEANKLKDDFLAKTTHEFKTPLNGIINILHAFNLSDNSLTEQQKENLLLVQIIAKRLSTLVNDILDISKLKYGELSLHITDVDINSTLKMVIRTIEFSRPVKPVEIINNIPENLPFIKADEQRVKQILYNLLDNAVKYTDIGTITIDGQANLKYIEISISDTGKGISNNKLRNIFDEYYRVNYGEYLPTAGQGLGLSITKKLIELQGGKIEVTSHLGKGTTVTFKLPISKSNYQTTYTSQIAITEDDNFITPYIINESNTYTILAVDDQYIGLKAIINALSDQDYKIVAVKSGKEALEFIEKNKSVDLVILDLMMPEMSGFDVCKFIREKYSVTELPILMVTAAIQPSDVLSSYEAGANDFLNKPFSHIQLVTRVNSLITIKKSAKHAIEMESALLLSQIKPHFLYNVLTAIASITNNNPQKGRELLFKFSSYLRMSFNFKQTDSLIPLEKELEYINTYIEIQNVRFENRIHYVLELDAPLDTQILPLLIEPLVENSIKYGLSSEKESILVKVTLIQQNNNLSVTVSDNSNGMKKENIEKVLSGKTESLGLYNLNKRLIKYYGTKLNIKSKIDSGTTVYFSLKI